MVAYSFKPRFVGAIVSGEKQQTIRLPRRRRTKVGDPLQLFTGPRMRPVRLGAATCTGFHQVRLDFSSHTIAFDDAIEINCEGGFEPLDAFAIRDGFRPGPSLIAMGVTPWELMATWWATTHPGAPVFAGELIEWGATFTPALAALPVSATQAA